MNGDDGRVQKVVLAVGMALAVGVAGVLVGVSLPGAPQPELDELPEIAGGPLDPEFAGPPAGLDSDELSELSDRLTRLEALLELDRGDVPAASPPQPQGLADEIAELRARLESLEAGRPEPEDPEIDTGSQVRPPMEPVVQSADATTVSERLKQLDVRISRYSWDKIVRGRFSWGLRPYWREQEALLTQLLSTDPRREDATKVLAALTQLTVASKHFTKAQSVIRQFGPAVGLSTTDVAAGEAAVLGKAGKHDAQRSKLESAIRGLAAGSPERLKLQQLLAAVKGIDAVTRLTLLRQMIAEQSTRGDASGMAAAAAASVKLVNVHVAAKEIDDARSVMDTMTAAAGNEPKAASQIIKGWNALLSALWKTKDLGRIDTLLDHMETLATRHSSLAKMKNTVEAWRKYMVKHRAKQAKKR